MTTEAEKTVTAKTPEQKLRRRFARTIWRDSKGDNLPKDAEERRKLWLEERPAARKTAKRLIAAIKKEGFELTEI